MKNILIISFSPLHRDPRVLRQIQALKQDYKITTIGYTPVEDDSVVYYPAKMPAKKSFSQKIYLLAFMVLYSFSNYAKKRWKLMMLCGFENILSQNIEKPDVIIANDWNGLYFASALKSKYDWLVKIYFDAHEYSPKDQNSFKSRLFIVNTLKKCKNDIDIMTAVCDGIARKYEKFFGFKNGFVRIVTNASEFNASLTPGDAKAGVIKLIHHGGAIRKRKLELMIEMMRYLDPHKYELTFMLVKTDPQYYEYLEKISKGYKNIKIIEPVNFHEITNTLNDYDIGVYILLPEIFNHKYALPNKLFEFVQARLAIAIGPSIEMAKVVNQYGLGVCADNFSPKSLANSIAQMTPCEIFDCKKNSDKHAKELSAEANIIKIRDIVAELARESA